MTRSIKTTLAMSAAAAALFATPAAASHTGIVAVNTPAGSVTLLNSAELNCPTSSEFRSTTVADLAWVTQAPEGTYVYVTGDVNVSCTNNDF